MKKVDGKNLAAKVKRPFVTEPCLLVLKEKHGDAHFYLKDDTDLFIYALMILEGRNLQRWYPEASEKPIPLDFDEHAIEKLPASLVVSAENRLREYRRDLKAWEEENEDAEAIRIALSEKDGRKAWEVLRRRRDCEYEECLIVGLCKSYG